MIASIKDALIADLNKVDLSDDARKQILYGNNDYMNYYRKAQYYYLVGNMHAIFVSNDVVNEIKDTNLYRYVNKIGGRDASIEELFGKDYDTDSLDVDVHEYIAQLMKKYGMVCRTFNDAILRMIDYHTNKNEETHNDFDFIKNKVIKNIINTYFYANSANKFSLKNNTFQYVTEFSDGKLRVTESKKNKILNEIKDYLKNNHYDINYNDNDEVIDKYAAVMASNYINLKRREIIEKNNVQFIKPDYSKLSAKKLRNEIIKYIYSLNINDAYKTSLIRDFNNGNYSSLRMFGNEANNLLNAYENNNIVSEKDIIDVIDNMYVNNKYKTYLKSCFFDKNYNELRMCEIDELTALVNKYEEQNKKGPIK